MEFGLKPAEGGDLWGHTVPQAKTAEEYGVDAVYLAQHHGFPDAPYWPAPLVGLAALASETSSIRLGTSIVELPLENPVALAGKIAQLDRIAEGRTSFGFGVGWREHEFKALDVPYSDRGPMMTENLKVLNAVFERGPTSFSGRFFEFDGFELSPEPIQEPRPDFYVGGASGPAFRRATQLANGYIAPGGLLDEQADLVRGFREQGDGRVLIQTGGVVVREESDEAIAGAREFVRRQKRPHLDEGNPHSGHGELGLDTDRQVRDYVRERTFIAGSVGESIEQLQAIIDVTSADEILLRISCDGWSHEDAMTTLDLLGTEVLPSFE